MDRTSVRIFRAPYPTPTYDEYFVQTKNCRYRIKNVEGDRLGTSAPNNVLLHYVVGIVARMVLPALYAYS